MRRPTGWTRTAAALATLGALGAWAPPPPADAAQTDAPQADRAPVERRAGDHDLAPRLREFLARRIEDLRARLERLEHAQGGLEGGRPIRELLAEMAPEDRRAFERPFDQRRPGPDGFGPGASDRPGPDSLEPEPAGPPPTSEEIRAFIATNLPELDENISRVEGVTPEGASRILDRLSPRITEVVLAERRDPTLGRLKLDELKIGLRVIESMRNVHQEIREHGMTPEFENAFRPNLVELLTQQANARERVRLREIELLEERVAAMREEAESNAGPSAEEIERIADRMIRRMSAARGRRPNDRDTSGDGAPRRTDSED